MWIKVEQLLIKVGWRDASLALRNLAKGLEHYYHSYLLLLVLLLLHIFKIHILFMIHIHCDHIISCPKHHSKWTNKKLSSNLSCDRASTCDWSWAVAQQSWMARCSPRALELSQGNQVKEQKNTLNTYNKLMKYFFFINSKFSSEEVFCELSSAGYHTSRPPTDIISGYQFFDINKLYWKRFPNHSSPLNILG